MKIEKNAINLPSCTSTVAFFCNQKKVINEVLATIMGAILMRIYSLKSLISIESESIALGYNLYHISQITKGQQSLVSPEVNDLF